MPTLAKLASNVEKAYMTKVSILNNASSALYDYPVLVELSGDIVEVGASWNLEVYDESFNSLDFFVLKWDKQEKKGELFLKYPELPAGEEMTAYVVVNKRRTESLSNPSAVVEIYDDFNWEYSDSGTTGSSTVATIGDLYFHVFDHGYNDAQWEIDVSEGEAVLSIKDTKTGDNEDALTLVSSKLFDPTKYLLEFKVACPNFQGVGSSSYYRAYVLGYESGQYSNTDNVGYAVLMINEKGRVLKVSDGTNEALSDDMNVLSVSTIQGYVRYRLLVRDGALKAYYNVGDGWTFWGSQGGYLPSGDVPVTLRTTAWGGAGPIYLKIDYVLLRKYVEPEPSVSVGKLNLIRVMDLM